MVECTFSSDLIVEVRRESMSDEMVAEAAWVSSGQNPEGLDPIEYQNKVAGLINFLMKNRHGTPFEHNSITFYVKAPIFVWREFMRHRIGISYNEESGRYKQLAPDFYVPAPHRPLIQTGKVGAYIFEPGSETQHSVLVNDLGYSAQIAYDRYQRQLDLGIAKEVARMCLPVNIYSSAFVTMNARSIMSFLSLRTKDESSLFPSFPMWEINNVADQIEDHWRALMPDTHYAFHANRRVSP